MCFMENAAGSCKCFKDLACKVAYKEMEALYLSALLKHLLRQLVSFLTFITPHFGSYFFGYGVWTASSLLETSCYFQVH